ncbi:unnamed protein product [Parnassius apollo]|uniref:(apollo) hypothetical protein n=1 Tax=Parnassius apollo TaxID=110799 RepID=A0A8S3WGP4_PARAO|nr:unnamed protein product [Parnassius apollo]
MLTLAEPPFPSSGQERWAPQYGISLPRFSMIDWLNQNSSKSPMNNLKITGTEALKKVPDSLFSDMPQYKEVIELLLEDIERGNHLLLVEKEGLGNKKIVDRLLQTLDRPTEYMQLHRDTTMQSLTVQLNTKDATGIYEDSPLVRAVKYGHVLVVDEADKAPIIVTSSLNTLMQNGEMVLSDNRRIIPKEFMNSFGGKSASFISVHENFRMIVLASRTGFPFLEEELSAPLLELETGEISTTVKAVGSSPVVTTAVMGSNSAGSQTITAIASGSAYATATAVTYGRGISTATAIAHGRSSASATAYSYDAGVATATVHTIDSSYGDGSAYAYESGVATATANASGSKVARAQAIARGNQVVINTQNMS